MTASSPRTKASVRGWAEGCHGLQLVVDEAEQHGAVAADAAADYDEVGGRGRR
jgi:hypothetical protein